VIRVRVVRDTNTSDPHYAVRDAALTLLSDLEANGVPVCLVEVTGHRERDQVLTVAPLLRGGAIGDAPSEYDDHADRVPVELVQELRAGRGKEGGP
jgi:hypothetical protein